MPMNDVVQLPALLPALPAIVLALWAMALSMLGAFRGEHTAVAVSWLAIALLVAAGVITLWLPAGTLVTFGGSFIVDPFARFLKLLALTGSAAAILMSFDYLAVEKQQKVKCPILHLLGAPDMRS